MSVVTDWFHIPGGRLTVPLDDVPEDVRAHTEFVRPGRELNRFPYHSLMDPWDEKP